MDILIRIEEWTEFNQGESGFPENDLQIKKAIKNLIENKVRIFVVDSHGARKWGLIIQNDDLVPVALNSDVK